MKSTSPLRVRRTPFDRIPLLYDAVMYLGSKVGPWSLRDEVGEIPDGRILDVGGGTGMRTSVVTSGRKAFIADLSGPMLKRALGKYNHPSVLARGEALPFAEGTFDVVLMIDMLHHASNPIGCVKDAARVLKPAGRLYILDFEASNFLGKTVLLYERVMGFGSRFLPAEEYASVLRNAGAQVDVRWVKSYEYLIVADKPVG